MTPEFRRERAAGARDDGRKVAHLADLAAADELLTALAQGRATDTGDPAARLLAALVADVTPRCPAATGASRA